SVEALPGPDDDRHRVVAGGAEEGAAVLLHPRCGGADRAADPVEPLPHQPGGGVADQAAGAADELADGAALPRLPQAERQLEGHEPHGRGRAVEEGGWVEVRVADPGPEVEPVGGGAHDVALAD